MTPLARAALLLVTVWCVLLGGLSLATDAGNGYGRDGVVLATFLLAGWLVWSTTPRVRLGPERPSRESGGHGMARRSAVLASAFAAGFVFLPAWLRIALEFGLGLGLSVHDLRLPQPPLGDGLLMCLAGVVAAPIFEEGLYRGHVLDALRPRFGAIAAIVLASLPFAFSHLVPWTVAGVFLFGLILGALRVGTRSLAGPIGFHAGSNAAIVLCGIPPVQLALSPMGAAISAGALLALCTWIARAGPDGPSPTTRAVRSWWGAGSREAPSRGFARAATGPARR